MEKVTHSDPPDPGEIFYTPESELLPSNSYSRKRPGIQHENLVLNKKTIVDPSTANPSIQTVFLNPAFNELINSYSDSDIGPFIIHVAREEPDPSAGLTIRAIKFGEFLFKNKFQDIVKEGVKSIGRNKISVEFSSATSANKFIHNPLLSLHKYKAFIPTFNISRMGLVRGIPIDWSMEELSRSLELPNGCGEILKARRLNRKQFVEGSPNWIPTQSVVLTFRGQMLPNKIFAFYSSLNVETYNLPTIMCLNCCRFGHTKNICRSKPRCSKCTQSHPGESCRVSKEAALCLHCSGNHFADDKTCPELTRQRLIKSAMSQENISFAEAATHYPPVRRSYAEVAKEMFSLSNPSTSNSDNLVNYSSPSANIHSYKKTIVKIPRPPSPRAKGYDKQTHYNISSPCPSSLGNGCAINSITSQPSSIDHLLRTLLVAINNHFSSKNILPDNAAQSSVINPSSSLLSAHHGSNKNPAMELQKSFSS